MYLSRVEIDFSDRKKTRSLTHVGAFHNWVESSFPREIALNERGRKLWRIDEIDSKHYLLVLSPDQPNLELLEAYGVKGSAETRDYNPLLDKLVVGERLRFRVKLNPVMSISTGKSSEKRGKVIPLVGTKNQLKYLEDRAENHGFLLNEEEFTIINSGFEILRRRNKKSLKIVSATYEGILTVMGLELFRAALLNGIGKKKAYGFGLITVILNR